jgi:dTDP-4-dehydrorhamnose 3,5-epimerase-like enzyme
MISSIDIMPKQSFLDKRGKIDIYEIEKKINFKLKRFFIVSGKKNIIRGRHAHKKCKQHLILISGKVEITLQDKKNKKIILLKKTGDNLYIPPLVWSSQKYLNFNSKILVLCDRKYEKKDYIKLISNL